ncbi:MAG: molybdopterin molybdotransferase [Methanofollis sp.]|nr:molybdopterin molybdotransferase [Methanofollis sp.]
MRYLSQVSLAEAVGCVRSTFPVPERNERLPLLRSVGRVTAVPVYAPYAVPPVHTASMDGIAVKSAETVGASDQRPVLLLHAVRVNTGNAVPGGYDAVILIEDVWTDGKEYRIRKPAGPMQHIRPAGEDIRAGGMALPAGHRIRPFDIGALATYGITEVRVRSVRAALIPTGSELISPGTPPKPGQVVESNTVMTAAFLEERGVDCVRYPITPDEPDLIRAAIEKAVGECDLVIVSAGSSAGTRDYTAAVIDELGEVLVHGIAIKPGKPAIIGSIAEKPVLGLPGYPLSAQTILRSVIAPLLDEWGFRGREEVRLPVVLARTLTSDIGFDEFVLHTVGRIGDRYVATPQSRGAGVQMASVRANAVVLVPAQTEGFDAGETVEVSLTADMASVEATLLLTGSHDPALDECANLAMARGIRAVSSNVGNRGGILAIRRDICHAAPLHLPGGGGDVGGTVAAALRGLPLAVVTVAGMPIGLVSREGAGDRNGLRFINRQRGSEMRAFIDTYLAGKDGEPAGMNVVEQEAQSHLAIAAAVRDGAADTGITSLAAASSCGLAFEQVGTERYVLVIREEHLDEPRVAALVQTVMSEEFTAALNRIGCYDTAATGTIVHVPAEKNDRMEKRS